ncbi:MAG: hypothetical protein RMJ07_05780 [Nitrososphaerota archaeon]|nr:hypothetical protein [Candidatus Bathyarchaeota archaeon]MDW8049169.1 hypothetical protein [Nitrososphaerota archaeon]
MPIIDIIAANIIYYYLLYAPPYIIDKAIFKSSLATSEKIVFYPLISMAILDFMGFLLPPYRDIENLKFVALFILSLLLIANQRREIQTQHLS